MFRPVPRSLLVFGIALALAGPAAVVATTTATAADAGAGLGSQPLGQAKKKGKKKEPLTATVNATLTYTQRGEINGGEQTQKLTVTIKDATATFRDGDTVASGKGPVSVAYEARFYTEDRSWHAGCDTELRESKANWSGKSDFGIFPTNERRTPTGKTQLKNGWGVEIPQVGKNLSKTMTTTGYYNDWESILMENCLTYPVNQPLGGWSPYWVNSWTVNGNLNGGGKGVYLSGVNVDGDTEGSAEGKIEFSRSVSKLGKGSGPLN